MKFCLKFLIWFYVHIVAYGKKGKIIDASLANWKDFPYMVAFVPFERCSGTLITRQWILTAAHCIPAEKNFTVQVSYGFIGLGALQRRLESSKFYIAHEDHAVIKDTTRLTNDIALLKLDNPIKLFFNVTVSKLSTKTIRPGSQCAAVGYAALNDSIVIVDGVPTVNITRDSKFKLRSKKVEVVSYKKCVFGNESKSLRSNNYLWTKILVNASLAGVSPGDDGGPLVCKGEKVGVFSMIYETPFRSKKKSGFKSVCGVYMRIEKYLTWIKENIERHSYESIELRSNVGNMYHQICIYLYSFVLFLIYL